MAQYYRDFVGATAGSAVPNSYYPWYTPTTGVVDNTTFAFPVYKESHSVNNEHPLVFNGIPLATDMELLGKVRMDTVEPSTTNDYQADLVLRGSGSSTTRNGYTVNFLRGQFINVEGYQNNTSFTLTGANFTFSANTWYWIRARLSGNTIQYRAWADGSSEPSTWNTATDSSNRVTDTGWAGFGAWKGLGNRYWQMMSVGTDGDSAPTSNPNTSLTVNNLAVATTEDAVVVSPKSEVTGGGPLYYGSFGAMLMGSTYWAGQISVPDLALVIANLSVANTMQNVTIVQNYLLAVSALNVATTTQNVQLIYDSLLAVQALSVAISMDNVALIQDYVLGLNNLSVSTTMDNVELFLQAVAAADNLLVGTTMQNVALIQQHMLTVANLLVATSTSSPAVAENRTLAIDALFSATSTENAILVQNYIMAMDNLIAGTSTENADLIQAYTLALQDLISQTSLQNVTVQTPMIVSPAIVQTLMDNVVLGLSPYIVVTNPEGELLPADNIAEGVLILTGQQNGQFETNTENSPGIYIPDFIPRGRF